MKSSAVNVPAERIAARPFPFVPLMALASHSRVEGIPVGPGRSFHSRIWVVQWPDGADHEGLFTLL